MLKTLPYPWTPRDIYGARLTLFPGYADMLRQEEFGDSATNPVSTRVTADGQSVGTVILPIDGHVMTTFPGYGAAYRPTIQSDSSGGRNSFLRFGASSQGSTLQVVNSLAAFNAFHTTQQYTIAFYIRFKAGGSIGGDAVNQTIFDSNGQSNSYAGCSLYRYSDGSLQWLPTKSGTYLVSGGLVSSDTTTLTAANGLWHAVVIQCNGVTCTMSFDGTQVASKSVTAGAPLGTNASYALTIGQSAVGTTHRAQFDLDNLLICDRVISAADLAKWQAFNPARNDAVNSLLREVDPRATECDLSALSHSFQWCTPSTAVDPVNQAPLLFTSTAPATSSAITTSATKVAYLQNRLGPQLLRDCSLSTSTYQPTWYVGAQNGRPTLRFAGTTSPETGTPISIPNYLMFGQQWYPGDKTWYWVGKQNSVGTPGQAGAQSGSHLLGYSSSTGGGYWVVTGSSYDSDQSLLILHSMPSGTDAGTSISVATYGNGAQAYNVYHGRQLNGNLQLGVNGNWSAYSASGAGCFVPDSIGLNYHQGVPTGTAEGTEDPNGNWELNGDCAEWGCVNGALPDHIFNKVLRRVANEYAILNMFFDQ